MAKRTPKTPGFKPGLFILSVFTFAMGACGVYGWVSGDHGLATRAILGFAAGVTAAVIPFTVIALGRTWSSLAVLPVLVVCMATQAVSFHNFVDVVVEAPHRADFTASLQPLEDEVIRATKRLDAAQAAFDAVEAPALPERCLLVACPNTVKANAAAYADALAPKKAALDTAKAERQTAITALAEARKAYQPMISSLAVWIIGGLLDLSIAFAIWGLEATARRLREKQAAAKPKAKRRKPKAKIIDYTGYPKLAANDR